MKNHYQLEKESYYKWYSYEQQATEDFYNRYSTYPGINYVVKNIKLNDDIALWLRIEIEHNLFAGFALFNKKDESQGSEHNIISYDLKQEVMRFLNVSEINNDNWWLLWCYLPTGSNNSKLDSVVVPNFKEMNEAAIRLSDKSNRQQFVSESILVIENHLLKLL